MKYLVLVLSNFVIFVVGSANESKLIIQGNAKCNLSTFTEAKKTDRLNSSITCGIDDGDDAVNIFFHRLGTWRVQITSNAYGNITTKENPKKNYLILKMPQNFETVYIDCHTTKKGYGPSSYYVTRIYFKRHVNKSGSLLPEKISTGHIMLPKQCKNSDEKRNFSANTMDFYVEVSTGHIMLPKQCKNSDEKRNFSANTMDFYVEGTTSIISGLVQNRILAMFTSHNNTFTTFYEYVDEEELRFDCNANNYEWIYDNTKVESKDKGSFKLMPNVTTATIVCKSNDSEHKITNAEIKLFKKSKKVISPLSENEFSGKPLSGSSNDLDKTTKPTIGTQPGPFPAIAAIVVCSLIFLIVLVFVTIRLFKKKPKPDCDSNINYENLPEHNRGAMPIPPQWQEAQYTTPLDRIANNDYAVPFQPTVEEMYASPVPKNRRAEPAYASNDNLGPTYAQTVPKQARKGVNVLPIASAAFAQTILNNEGKGVSALPKDSTPTKLSLKPAIAKKPNSKKEEYEISYTEITPSESSYVSVNPYEELNSDCSYVQVGSESPYSDLDNLQNREKYINVFNNTRYVNADGKEYAEPEYCEVNRLKKEVYTGPT